MSKRYLKLMPHGLPSRLRLVPEHRDCAGRSRRSGRHPGGRGRSAGVPVFGLISASSSGLSANTRPGSSRSAYFVAGRMRTARQARAVPCRSGRAGRTCSWRAQQGRAACGSRSRTARRRAPRSVKIAKRYWPPAPVAIAVGMMQPTRPTGAAIVANSSAKSLVCLQRVDAGCRQPLRAVREYARAAANRNVDFTSRRAAR